jgi:hypothetical protein
MTAQPRPRQALAKFGRLLWWVVFAVGSAVEFLPWLLLVPLLIVGAVVDAARDWVISYCLEYEKSHGGRNDTP